MSRPSRRALRQSPASPARVCAEVLVVLVALAVLYLPGRAHAESLEVGHCEPRVSIPR